MNAMPIRRFVARLALGLTLGLILAAGVHLVAVLAMPRLGTNSAFFRVAQSRGVEETTLLPRADAAALPAPYADPATAISVCRFDLAEGPLRVVAPLASFPMSLSVHDRRGGAVFAIPDRVATRGQIALVLMTRRQLDEAIAREDENEPSRDLRVAVSDPQGLVVLRAVALFPSQRLPTEAAVAGLTCTGEDG